MIVFALLVIVVCVGVVFLASHKTSAEDPTYIFLEETEDWERPHRWREHATTKEKF